MNESQFMQWLLDFQGYFPGFGAYCERLERQSDAYKGWYMTLKRFDQIVMATVTDRIVGGKFRALEATDYPNFAVKIRPLCNIVHDETKRDDRREEYRRKPNEPTIFEMVTTGSYRERFLAGNAAIQLARGEEYSKQKELAMLKCVVAIFDTDDPQELAIETTRLEEEFGFLVDEIKEQMK